MSAARSLQRSRLVWTVHAAADLDRIAAFIALDDAVAAVLWVEQLVAAAERLPGAPQMGRKVPELGPADVRELIQGKYRVVYRLLGEQVQVLTVFEGHRLLRPTDLQ